MSRVHFLQLVALSALWGASFPMLRIASPLLGPPVVTAGRIGIGALTLALIMLWVRERWPWSHWRRLVPLGLLSVALPFLLFAWSALHLPAGYIALLNSAAIVFGALASAWAGEDQLSLRKVLGVLLGLAGVAMVVQLGPVAITPEVLKGIGAALLATMCFGFSTPIMKRATRELPPLAIAGVVHLAAAAALLPMGLAAWPAAQPTALTVAIVLVLGVVTSGLAFWAHLRIMRHTTPVAAMSPTFMIPVFGVAWGHLALGEAVGLGLVAGGAMVLAAAALITGVRPAWPAWLRR